MFAAVVAALALGAVGASAASAADGHAQITVDGNPCDVLFDRSAWSGDSSTLSNVRLDPSGTCGVDSITGSGTMNADSNGDASFEGAFTFRILFNLVSCSYEGAAIGSWDPGNGPAPDHTSDAGKVFDLAGEADQTAGSSLCPESGEFTLAGWVKD